MTPYRPILRRALTLAAVCALGGGVLTLALAPAAVAAGTTLYVAVGGTDSGDCSSEAAPCLTIQHAIDVAGDGTGDVIAIGLGTFAQNLTIAKSVTIVGAGEGATIITNDPEFAAGTIVTIEDGAASVFISGVTINHQAATPPLPATAHGVAIETNAVVHIDHSSVAFNGGEGIWLTDGEVQLTAATVAGNGGNGIATSATSGKAVAITVDHSTITDNNKSGLQISSGDGIVTDSVISGNGNAALGGGGIDFTAANKQLDISRSTVSDNGTDGVHFSGGALTVTASTVSGNGGKGIDAQVGALDVTASTIAGNGAEGVLIAVGTSSPQIYQSTIAGNGAGSVPAVGLRYEGRMTVRVGATIIANNVNGDCAADGGGGSIGDVGYNLSGDSSCGFSATHRSMSGTDPMLGALANNGGPTATMALPATSPAVDAIVPGPIALRAPGRALQAIPDSASVGFCAAGTTDQRGVGRPQNGKCDIGAYELVRAGGGSRGDEGSTSPSPTPTPTASTSPSSLPAATSTPATANTSPASSTTQVSGLAQTGVGADRYAAAGILLLVIGTLLLLALRRVERRH